MGFSRPLARAEARLPDIAWPTDLGLAGKNELSVAIRRGTLAGAKLAELKLGLGIREAKALAFQITREPGKCHRCNKPLREPISVCESCRSANLDW